MLDYLIVGSGLFGSVFAHESVKRGKKVLIIEKRKHTGGNIYCENINDINVHMYGAHIFHTNDQNLWTYVNKFCRFNNYINSPVAISNGKLYNLPFNMNTFYQIWGVMTPEEAKAKLEEQTSIYKNIVPENLEEQALRLVGKDIYETLIKEYTEKQWGMSCKSLSPNIIKRLPIRFTFDNNYFNDRYQGIPIGGYNVLINNLLNGIEVKLEVDFFENRVYWESISKKILYTGQIDQLYNYKFGNLDYRSLKFEHTVFDNVENYQGNAVVNFSNKSIPYTRIIEHKHFEFLTSKNTIITKEYPHKFVKGEEPYYPINNNVNDAIFKRYLDLNNSYGKYLLGGRLAEYKYYDMHQVIASALKLVKNEFEGI